MEADVLPLNYSRNLFRTINLNRLRELANTMEHHSTYNGCINTTWEGGKMKAKRERYQHGSVRQVPRSQGFAWEFRYYSTASDGSRKLKVQTFDSVKCPD